MWNKSRKGSQHNSGEKRYPPRWDKAIPQPPQHNSVREWEKTGYTREGTQTSNSPTWYRITSRKKKAEAINRGCHRSQGPREGINTGKNLLGAPRPIKKKRGGEAPEKKSQSG